MEEICSISRKWGSLVIGNFLTFGNDDYNTPEIFIGKIKNKWLSRCLWVVACQVPCALCWARRANGVMGEWRAAGASQPSAVLAMVWMMVGASQMRYSR